MIICLGTQIPERDMVQQCSGENPTLPCFPFHCNDSKLSLYHTLFDIERSKYFSNTIFKTKLWSWFSPEQISRAMFETMPNKFGFKMDKTLWNCVTFYQKLLSLFPYTPLFNHGCVKLYLCAELMGWGVIASYQWYGEYRLSYISDIKQQNLSAVHVFSFFLQIYS